MNKIDTKTRFIILGVFAIIFFVIYLITNSGYYIKSQYNRFKKSEYKSTILQKLDENPYKYNRIYFNNAKKTSIPREIFDALKIGDSVIKLKNSDSMIFKTKKKLIFFDENKHLRSKLN